MGSYHLCGVAHRRMACRLAGSPIMTKAGDDVSTVALSDGRKVGYRVYGAADGRPVLGLHGTPGSHLKFAAADDPARGHGLRIISIDRWGYGATCAHPAPSLTAFARDCAEVLSRLGIARSAVVGISGGGPYTSAVASVLGDRVSCAALVSPVGPILQAGLGWRQLSALHVIGFRILPHWPGGARTAFAPFRALALARPSAAAALAASRVCKADRLVAGDASFRQTLGEMFATGLRPGTSGPAIDLAMFGRTWDAAPQDIGCPTRIWIGLDDRNVPVTAAVKLGRMIPGAETTLIEGAGHYWIANNFDTVLGWIARQQF
jgi:pimeloyl-ACP methyl ester carboxylesterase